MASTCNRFRALDFGICNVLYLMYELLTDVDHVMVEVADELGTSLMILADGPKLQLFIRPLLFFWRRYFRCC